MNLDNIETRKIKGTKRELTLRIEKYAGDGVSLGYEDNKVIFVRYALPGELVRINIYKEAKDYAMAEPVEIFEASPDRIEPACPYFGFCGGCDYQMLSYKNQIKMKKQIVLETLHRIGKVELEDFTSVIESPEKLYYRNTTTFKVNPHRKLIGFFRRDTKFIVDIDQCRIAMPGINRALADMRTNDPFAKHNFKVRTTLDGDTVVNWVESTLYEDRPVYETVKSGGHEIKFKVSKDSFFQVNDSMIPLWIEKIISFLDKEKSERIFDLYCGIGLITLFVSFYARETIGVEIAKSSVKDARHNLKINKIDSNIRFIRGDVMEELPRLGKADVIIIDPPRAGLDKESVQMLLDLEPNKIIYSSCKASTLARDVQLLSKKYELKECVLVDMFPQTHHVELINLLMKK